MLSHVSPDEKLACRDLVFSMGAIFETGDILRLLGRYELVSLEYPCALWGQAGLLYGIFTWQTLSHPIDPLLLRCAGDSSM